MKIKHRITVDGVDLPLDIWVERRRGIRFSIARKSVNLRVPMGISPEALHEQVAKTTEWVESLLIDNPSILDRFKTKTYATGDVVIVGERQYILDISLVDKKNHSAKMDENTIFFKLSQSASIQEQNRVIKKLLSRIISKDFLPEIAKRVDELNDAFFQEDINKISLKYNVSNWGSCSSRRNLNFSSRLLLAPKEVIDYVIIHELAHLKEANHSSKFWAIVQNIMPDYKEKEQWLTKHGKTLDF